MPETDSYPAETVAIDTAYGAVTSLSPSLTFTSLTPPAAGRLVPYGADPRVVAIGDFMGAAEGPGSLRASPAARDSP